ncbi:sensor histidine kinase [Loktanella sp. DJP18]|uniref:sensor histidine kinase n=1 Tax=Loktanella sp. DJP18 TaxID=3409788 RepID=UPI003BB73BE9
MLRRKLSEFDLVDDLAGRLPRLVVQAGFGLLCFLAALVIRALIDMFAYGAGPFSLIYPAIMIATLYGRWQAGVVTYLLCFLHAWYVVLPVVYSFRFAELGDPSRTFVNGVAALFILFFAEVFRSAVRRARQERNREITVQNLLMRELEHRTKNNFAMVSSLLSMQQRRTTSAEARAALMSAATRVQSFAAIHQTIYTTDHYSGDVTLQHYFTPLVRELERGLFDGHRVTITLDCDPVSVNRDRALALGLILSELVTNAAKHAFPDERAGTIAVTYRQPEDGPWRMTVHDDGTGMTASDTDADPAGSGLGKVLMSSFAETAGGRIVVDAVATGTSISLVEAAD